MKLVIRQQITPEAGVPNLHLGAGLHGPGTVKEKQSRKDVDIFFILSFLPSDRFTSSAGNSQQRKIPLWWMFRHL